MVVDKRVKPNNLKPNSSFPGDHSKREPPDPMPNSEVKPLSADGSVGLPHVRVGHCQGFITKTSVSDDAEVFFCLGNVLLSHGEFYIESRPGAIKII